MSFLVSPCTLLHARSLPSLAARGSFSASHSYAHRLSRQDVCLSAIVSEIKKPAFPPLPFPKPNAVQHQKGSQQHWRYPAIQPAHRARECIPSRNLHLFEAQASCRLARTYNPSSSRPRRPRPLPWIRVGGAESHFGHARFMLASICHGRPFSAPGCTARATHRGR